MCGVGCAAVAPPLPPNYVDLVPATTAVVLRGEDWLCSGVAVDDHLVLTAAHCTDKGEFEVIVFPGEARLATVKSVDPIRDLALVHTFGEPLKAQARYASTPPKEGDLLFLVGFGCFGSINIAPGLYVTRAPGNQLAIAMAVCFGDSGGPVFNIRGELVGIMSSRAVEVPIGLAEDVTGY
jgi:serine protease Do